MGLFPANTLHHIIGDDMGGMEGDEYEEWSIIVVERDELKSIDIFQLVPFPQL